jgi:putative ABC transport system permease protein
MGGAMRPSLVSLGRNWIASGTIVASAALAIAAATVLFAVAHAVFIDPLPYAGQRRLVLIGHDFPEAPAIDYAVSLREIETLEASTLFDAGVVVDARGGNLHSQGGPPLPVNVAAVEPGVFDMTGVMPDIGRPFLEGERHAPVAVLSARLHRERFGGAGDIVGRTLRVGNEELVVTGVMPERFRLWDADLWRPYDRGSIADHGSRNLQYLARLAPGVGSAKAAGRLGDLSRQLAAEGVRESYPDGFRLHAVSLVQVVTGDLRPALYGLLAAMFLVLVVAAANIATLQGAQYAGRAREIAVRKALGARPRALFAAAMTEVAVLVAVGGGLGLLLGRQALGSAVALIPFDALPREASIELGWGVALAIATVLSAMALAVAALLAWRAWSVDGALALTGRERGALGGGRGRFLATFTVAQVALAVTVGLFATGMMRTYSELMAVDPGFTLADRPVASLRLEADRYPTREQAVAHLEEVLGAVAELPAVAGIGAIDLLPFHHFVWNDGVEVDASALAEPRADYHFVAGDYFAVLGIPLLEGRLLGPEDRPGAEPVAVVSRLFADRAWPGAPAVGRSVRLLGEDEPVWRRVVGVVGDIHQRSLHEPPQPTLYLPHSQGTQAASGGVRRGMQVVIEPREGAHFAFEEVRSVVAGVDPYQALGGLDTLAARALRSTGGRRLALWVLGGLALLAVVVSMIGVFSILRHEVERNTRALGLRKSLGATGSDILFHVARWGLSRVAAGIVAGAVLASSLALAARALLYGVEPWSPSILLGVSLATLAVALLAVAGPAARAARLPPMAAMRAE